MLFSNLVSLSDTADILLVSLLLYLALVLLRRTQSYTILGGILLLLAIYAMAFTFNLFLTALILQYFFTFLIVILVVVFQKELRNFFEWIFVLGVSRRKRDSLTEILSIEILETVEYLAHKKIGAIIVLAGSQPLGRLLENGFLLGGHISKPLLLSIFDPSSPGHDGAVVIEGNTVKKFGVHLPLAEKFQKYKELGTRHRSALGLSQRSDALIIVVSEERGTISLAEQGELTVMENPSDFKEAIKAFLIEEESPYGSWRRWITQNTQEKVLALLLATALWIIFVLRAKLALQAQ